MMLAGLALLLFPLLLLPGVAARAETAADRGYRTLLTVPLEPPMMTEREYFDLWQVWPEPERSRAERATPAERSRMTLSRYGFQESPDRPGPVPQQFTSDGKGNLSMNCLACHGGAVAGRVVPGLGNAWIDLTTFVEDLDRLYRTRGVAVPPPPPAAPQVPLPPVRGVNNAWGLAISYMLLRDLDLNLSVRPQFAVPTAAQLDLPVKTPPYWISKRKSRFYADSFIAKSHRDIMQFSFQYSMSRQQIVAQEDAFRDIYAWINSVPSPAYPFPIDRDLAHRGQALFNRDCAGCHGNFGRGGRYPERVVALEEVGTDPVRVRDFPRDFARHLAASWVGDYGRTPLFSAIRGYVAPPLDGIWASAPYLHNGSVPTLWDLLTPGSRPKVWRRSEAGYDQKKLGLEVTVYEDLPVEASTPQQRRQFYQTGLRGLGNQGHRYPLGGLDEAEKAALIEYLKTL
jgi:mono/diheme cytochrome c family protein